jgi:predicted nucleic acid-binding protein
MVQAKQRGMVTSIRPLLDQLLSYDFRISPRLYALALKQADESL